MSGSIVSGIVVATVATTAIYYGYKGYTSGSLPGTLNNDAWTAKEEDYKKQQRINPLSNPARAE